MDNNLSNYQKCECHSCTQLRRTIESSPPVLPNGGYTYTPIMQPCWCGRTYPHSCTWV